MGALRLAACLAAALVWGCVALTGGIVAPEVHVARVAPLESTLFEQRVQVELRIRNPNDVALRFDGIDFELLVDDQPLTRGFANQAFEVPRLGEHVVSVTATTTALDVVRQVLSLGARRDFEYRLEGRLFLVEPRQRTLAFSQSGRPLR